MRQMNRSGLEPLISALSAQLGNTSSLSQRERLFERSGVRSDHLRVKGFSRRGRLEADT